MNEQELKKAEEYVKMIEAIGVSIYDHEISEIVVDLFPALVAEVRRMKAENANIRMINEQIGRDNGSLREENARLIAQVATAKEIVQAGIDIMDNDQLAQWRGVRSFLEQDTDDYEGGNS